MISPENYSHFELTYKFSSGEIAALAKFLRNNENSLPKELENFYNCLQKSVYDCLSLEEVKQFFS